MVWKHGSVDACCISLFSCVLGSWKQPKNGVSFKIMRWHCLNDVQIYLSDTQIWSIQNKSNDLQKPLKNPEGELWQTREPHKSPGTIQQRKIWQNFTLTSADSLGSTKNQVPKLVRMVLVKLFSRIHREENQRHFYEMISQCYESTSTIQDRISNRHVKDSFYLIYIVI